MNYTDVNVGYQQKLYKMLIFPVVFLMAAVCLWKKPEDSGYDLEMNRKNLRIPLRLLHKAGAILFLIELLWLN